MRPVDFDALAAIGELLQGLGSTGILVLMLYMFMQGKVVPEVILNKLITALESNTQLLADKLRKDIKDAVKEGVIEGYYERERREK